MKLLGFSAREFFRIGLAAAVFFLIAKWVAPKLGQPALTAVTEKL